jgi:hypothetical protein
MVTQYIIDGVFTIFIVLAGYHAYSVDKELGALSRLVSTYHEALKVKDAVTVISDKPAVTIPDPGKLARAERLRRDQIAAAQMAGMPADVLDYHESRYQ